MLQQVRKDIIKYALNFDILNVNTYSGYKGDLLVKITTLESDDYIVDSIRDKAKELGMEVVIKDNKAHLLYEIYCIIPDDDSYGLKI
ncbi:MAG: hypothetical protein R3302_07795 [Sulfurimonadaceae bacterium]|nr:hypothetical protein [Sulfurimonadaceae bacterium]